MPQCICCNSWIKQPKTQCLKCGYSNLNYWEWLLKNRPWEIPVSVVTHAVDVPHAVDVQSDWVLLHDCLNEYVLVDNYVD